MAADFSLELHLHHQRDWSRRTFGPGPRTHGITAHIRKELAEIEQAPNDLSEWIDVLLLAFDGAWRAGHSPGDIVAALRAKQVKNESRQWPDWRTLPQDVPLEHVPNYDDTQANAQRLACKRCGNVFDVTHPRVGWMCSPCVNYLANWTSHL